VQLTTEKGCKITQKARQKQNKNIAKTFFDLYNLCCNLPLRIARSRTRCRRATSWPECRHKPEIKILTCNKQSKILNTFFQYQFLNRQTSYYINVDLNPYFAVTIL